MEMANLHHRPSLDQINLNKSFYISQNLNQLVKAPDFMGYSSRMSIEKWNTDVTESRFELPPKLCPETSSKFKHYPEIYIGKYSGRSKTDS